MAYKINPNSLKNLTNRFPKGLIPWNKGKKGLQIGWLKGTKGLIKPNSGQFKKGHKTWTKDLPKELHPAYGKHKSIETRKKISETKVREKNPMWKGGVATIHQVIRKSLEYKLWREAVYKRDNWTCVFCKRKRGWSKKEKQQVKIEADHIKSFSSFPELRFAIDNGRTLCRECHLKTDTYGGKSRKKLLN